jgi:hypothetical protein
MPTMIDRGASPRSSSASRTVVSLLIFASWTAAIQGCEPQRMLVPDSTPPPVDTGVEVDSGVEMDTGVSRPDVPMPDVRMDAPDVTMCDPDRCFDDCVAMGANTGRCMQGMCSCRFPDSGTLTDSATADRADVPSESSIRGCMSNEECPASQYCMATSCTGPGTCALRQERDPNRCEPDPVPSCGCDGLLYPSACARTALGVRQDPMRRCNGDAAVIPMSDASRDAR